MKRLHLFEFEDLPWFPSVVREGMMDFLRFMISRIGIYDPVVPLLQEILEQSGQTEILDLCSGGGGSIADLQGQLSRRMKQPVPVTVSDKHPNLPAFAYLQEQSGGAIRFLAEPVDATRVPPGQNGARTLFSAFHHFSPKQARAILQDAVRNQVPIGIFEGAGKQIHEILLVLLVFPFVILAVMPFIRPFKWSRLFFTYLIPLIPLCTLWDGTVSILRLYTPNHLLQLTTGLTGPPYTWKAGYARHRTGARVIYLVGHPQTRR